MTFLETAHLSLRKVEPGDYEVYFRDYLMDKEMDRLMCRSGCETEEDALLSFDWFLHKEERAYVIVYKESGCVIGNLTVYNTPPAVIAEDPAFAGQSGRALSFAMSPAWQRRGLMFEAVRGVIDHLFHAESTDYISCGYLSFNEPSRRLQEKLGFTYHTTESFCADGTAFTSMENILRKG